MMNTMFDAKRHAVGRFHHRHGGVRREQGHQQALVYRIEVLDQHECHARVGRQIVEECGKRVQAARRGADRHGQERQMVAVTKSPSRASSCMTPAWAPARASTRRLRGALPAP
jgi:hypothetical protein